MMKKILRRFLEAIGVEPDREQIIERSQVVMTLHHCDPTTGEVVSETIFLKDGSRHTIPVYKVMAYAN